MPCYTEWDAYLEPGTEAYDRRRRELEAKLRAVRHAIDYYYSAAGANVPRASFHRRMAGFIETAEHAFREHEEPPGEAEILDRISHHLSCDEVHFTTLYDLATLLDPEDSGQAGYVRVILACANWMRSGL